MKTAVREQVNRMDAVAYFTLLAQLMKDNPPAAADAPELAKFAKIGLVPGKDFDASKLDADFVKRIPAGRLRPHHASVQGQQGIRNINGWMFDSETGIYGTDYLNRAFVTAIGLGANRIEDACYPTSLKDADGKDYLGSNKYVVHFPKGQLPPVGGFWSVTMYDANYFFVANPINRYSISARQNLSQIRMALSTSTSRDSPRPDKESELASCAEGKFILMLRLYWPNAKPPSIIDGTWSPPPASRVASN